MGKTQTQTQTQTTAQSQTPTVDLSRLAGSLRVSIGLLVRRLRQDRVEGDLSWPEMSALSRLEREGPTTAGGLARREQISPQSMGATLAALESRGLIDRQADPDDGRKYFISVSPTGRQAVNDQRNHREEQLADALSAAFTRSELKQLHAAAPLIERLAQAI
jgi:DNA-binding MarR family transcriptional regulator